EHGGDAVTLRGARVGDARRLAVPDQLAAAFRQDAAEDFDEGALARAVLADERVNLAGLDLERAIGERDRLAEIAAQAAERDQRRGRVREGRRAHICILTWGSRP